jgi:phosphoglycerate dehydrogenase-like enzyme
MKPSAYVICTSRGKCIDNKALYDALVGKQIAGAAVDDPEEEPMKMKHWSPEGNPLFRLDISSARRIPLRKRSVAAGVQARCVQ